MGYYTPNIVVKCLPLCLSLFFSPISVQRSQRVRKGSKGSTSSRYPPYPLNLGISMWRTRRGVGNRDGWDRVWDTAWVGGGAGSTRRGIDVVSNLLFGEQVSGVSYFLLSTP